MAVVIAFSAYLQFITQDFKIFSLINLISNIILLVGSYSYVFKKKILESKKWEIIFKFLIGLLVINLIYQVWPSNYVGNFSLLNGALLTNIFAYLLITVFFIPLYIAVYRLGLPIKGSKSKKN